MSFISQFVRRGKVTPYWCWHRTNRWKQNVSRSSFILHRNGEKWSKISKIIIVKQSQKIRINQLELTPKFFNFKKNWRFTIRVHLPIRKLLFICHMRWRKKKSSFRINRFVNNNLNFTISYDQPFCISKTRCDIPQYPVP